VNVDKWVLRFAGTVVLASAALTYWVSPYWLWLAVFVGANLLQSSFTGFCPLAKLLVKLHVQPGRAFE
jgi:Inner membrane protein YgaP-like, transmembrane domain